MLEMIFLQHGNLYHFNYSSGIFCCCCFYGSMYGALKKSVNNMISTVLAAVINIIFNYIMILRIGAFGAIVGTCMAYVFLAFYRMFDVNRCLNLQIDMKKFMLNILVMFVQAFFITIDFYKYLVFVCYDNNIFMD